VSAKATSLGLQVVVAICGVAAGVYLATSGTSDTQATSVATAAAGVSAVGGGPVQPPEEVKLLPRRPRDFGVRLTAPKRGDRPYEEVVGEGLPDVEIPHCPAVRSGRKKPLVYGLGSSTMGGLAKVLGDELKKFGVRMRKWAKAGSGLARPDFHDWPGEVPSVVRDYDPDVFVVVLGTNDNQAVWDAKKKKWYRPNDPKWAPTYRWRIKKLLRTLNQMRPRWVFWIGPNLLDRDSSRRVGKRINTMMKQEVAKWGGDAWFIDLYNAGRTKSGDPKKYLEKPGGGTYKLRGNDGIHLLYSGLRWALAEPVLRKLRPCIEGDGVRGFVPGPRPRREFHLEDDRRERRP